MQQPIGLLSDNINWVQPLARAMDTAGVPSRLIPFPHPPFTEFDGRAYPKVIFNRVAMLTTAREQMPDGLLKSNVGGFGAGVWAPESPD